MRSINDTYIPPLPVFRGINTPLLSLAYGYCSAGKRPTAQRFKSPKFFVGLSAIHKANTQDTTKAVHGFWKINKGKK